MFGGFRLGLVSLRFLAKFDFGLEEEEEVVKVVVSDAKAAVRSLGLGVLVVAEKSTRAIDVSRKSLCMNGMWIGGFETTEKTALTFGVVM